MASSLKNRLQRIRTMTHTETPKPILLPPVKTQRENLTGFDDANFGTEWISVGYKFLKRSIVSKITFDVPAKLPEELKVLVPDFMRFNRKSVAPEDLLFFDLETTGLSGGAGTLAFLAAIGFFVPVTQRKSDSQSSKQSYKLQIDQYLLLDYPGEPEFLESIIPILNDEKKIVVTYNGKTFDTKLFRTRCLMNGMKPPVYDEADLLHPARRLWKHILPNCSQAEIETSILGLDRTGDISGAFAPQIWFDFLNNENPSDLLGICDHNNKDIEGLASLFSLIAKIAATPIEVLQKYQFDIEAAALRWRDFARFVSSNQAIQHQSKKLMSYCIEKKYPKAMYLCAHDLLKKGFYDEGVSSFKKLLEMEIALNLRSSVLNKLAIDAEWRLKDHIQALNYTEELLRMENLSESFRKKVEQRKERLLKKLSF